MDMRVSFGDNLRVDVEVGGFAVHTDQPVVAGGDGSAPAPFDLFLASLATCAGYFMLVFMKQRGIDPQGSGVIMTTEKDPERKMVGLVRFELHLPPGFPEKYEAAVARAVDQCTVKRHVLDPPRFEVVTTRRGST